MLSARDVGLDLHAKCRATSSERKHKENVENQSGCAVGYDQLQKHNHTERLQPMQQKHHPDASHRIACLGAVVCAIFIAIVLGSDRSAVGQERPPQMLKVRISDDGHSFVLGDSGKAFVPWGFNYLGEYGKLVEESWDSDWERVE